MEFEGIRVESAALGEFATQLSREMTQLENPSAGRRARVQPEFATTIGRKFI